MTLLFNREYPFQSKKRSKKRYLVTLGIGGNVKNTKKRFKKLFIYLNRSRVVDIVYTSPILKNPPFGYKRQSDFYNAIVVVKSDLSPINMLKFILRIEKFFKRVRSFKNSPRTLDIDIIFFDKISVNRRDLTIPHPFCYERESVLIPLAYIIKRVMR